MPPKHSYADRVYTTSVVGYPELKHAASDENGCKNFSEIIAQSIELGGYTEDTQLTAVESVRRSSKTQATACGETGKVAAAILSMNVRRLISIHLLC